MSALVGSMVGVFLWCLGLVLSWLVAGQVTCVEEQLNALGQLQSIKGLPPFDKLEQNNFNWFHVGLCANAAPGFMAVRPRANDRVHLHFTDGLACFDKQTCCDSGLLDTGEFFTVDRVADLSCGTTWQELVDRGQQPPIQLEGLLSDVADNPLRDYTLILAPHCSGDFFLADAPYANVDGCERNLTGNDFGQSAAQYVTQYLANTVKKVVVTGSGTGGIGSIYHGAWVRLSLSLQFRRSQLLTEKCCGMRIACVGPGEQNRSKG